MFHTLRALADVVLVGAGTVRSEAYGPVELDARVRRQRAERGQAEVPPIAVVTGSGNLDFTSPFFVAAEARPIVITTSAVGEGSRHRAEEVADVVVAGQDRVEPGLVLEQFHRSGFRSVLLEGGPGLNADVVDAGLLDELCLTLPPRLVGGSGPRILSGPELPRPLRLRIVHLLEEDGFLFYRLAVDPSEPRPA